MSEATAALHQAAALVGGSARYFRRHVDRYRTILEHVGVPSQAVLDAGVGYGYLTAAMTALGHDVTGLDLYYADIAARACAAAGTPLVIANLERPLPFADHAFDVVILAEVIEHFAAGPEHALDEVRRVLRPSGSLVLTTPNRDSVVNRAKRRFGRSHEGADEHQVEVAGRTYRYGHQQFLTMAGLVGLVERSGFAVTQRATLFAGRVSPGGPLGTIAAGGVRLAGTLVPGLRNILLVVAVPLP